MKRKLVSVLLALSVVISVFSVAVTATAVNTGVLGDADGDGKVTTSDALIVLRAAAGIEDNLTDDVRALCDVNNDGVLTLFDARQILRAAASLITLERTGLFSGFASDYSGITSQEELLTYFNTNINKIKSEKYGFTAEKNSEMKTFKFTNASFLGQPTTNTDDLIEKIFSIADEDETEPEYVIPGKSSTNIVSVEGKTYVSTLSSSDIYGSKAEYDSSRGILTITIAIPDSEKCDINDSSYVKVFNSDNLLGVTENVLNKILTGVADGTEVVHYKNAKLVAEFDVATGRVESYETSYETHVYVGSAKNGLFTLEGVDYSTLNTATYVDFVYE